MSPFFPPALAAAALLTLGIQPVSAAEPDAVSGPVAVALTFDDLPAHGPMPAGVDRAAVAGTFVSALKAVKAPPVYGMLNAVALATDPSSAKALDVWLAGGNFLANHTYAHKDPNQESAAGFIADIEKNEPLLQRYMGSNDWHYLRLPFLRMGDTAEKRATVMKFMKDKGYRLADVSIGFNDYDYNAPYVRCLAKNDTTAIAQLETRWMTAASRAIDTSRSRAHAVFGRDVKYVYLLHFGVFDAKMLPRFLDLLQNKNLKLTTLPDALSDPAYTEYSAVNSSWGGSMIQRAAEAKQIRLPGPPRDTDTPLDRVCR